MSSALNPGPGLSDRISFLITSAIKIVGLAVAVFEIFLTAHPAFLIVALSGFMMAGAQVSERAVSMFLDRLIGPAAVQPPEDRK